MLTAFYRLYKMAYESKNADISVKINQKPFQERMAGSRGNFTHCVKNERKNFLSFYFVFIQINWFELF